MPIYRVMDINKIGSIGKVGKIEVGGAIKGTERLVNGANDILSISHEAKKAHELDYLKNLAFNAISGMPDVRSDKIDIASSRIKEGYYNKNIGAIVESLLNSSI